MSAINRLERITSHLQPQAGFISTHDTAAAVHHFSHIKEAPPDEIFNTGIRYRADTSPNKVDLGVGAYRTDEGKPLVLNCVRKAEALIAKDSSLNHEYLGIDGDPKFITAARDLMFGKDSKATKEKRIATAQSLSGTGSLRVGVEFVAHYLPKGTTIYYSKPTWGNHNSIFAAAGVPAKPYRYWDAKGRKLDLNGLLEDIKNAPDRSVILLHACAHNPTGVDPTHEQWKQIAEVMAAKSHLPFFDSAYQGFATGSLDGDSWAIRYFVDQGFDMITSQSFAKNFGLYNERIGTISIISSDAKTSAAVLSQLKLVIRPNYSNPPVHGARIVSTILNDPALYAEWVEELKGMSGRIIKMRHTLYDELKRLGTPGDWTHLTSQIGMFTFTGLTPKQVNCLIEKHHIYLLGNGRISMAGINSKNVKYIAAAIHDAVTNIKE